jgi:3-oxoacyl-[acyl-carrier protein] reductase
MTQDTFSLQGKIAVVTGGSGGIGAATARLLAEAGARVVVVYHRGEARAREIVESLAGEGHRHLPMALDDSASIQALAEAVGALHGRVDILVNAAGFTQPVPHADLDGLTDALFDAVMVSNVRGPFALVRAFQPWLRVEGGVVVNVSSISGFTGSGSSVAYCASKAALDNMTLSLARALGPRIRFLAVSPGAVATDFVAGRDRAALEKIAAATPLQQVVEPEDVAKAILACTTHLGMTTGARIVVDGGRFLV